MSAFAIRWARRNLFAKPFDTLLSILIIPLSVWALYSFAHWTLEVAQWDVVRENMRVLMVGMFPADELWRAWVVAVLIAALLGLAVGAGFTFKGRHAAIVFVAFAIGAAVMTAWDPVGLAWLLGCDAVLIGGWFIASSSERTRRLIPYLGTAGLIGIFAILAPAGVANWGGLLLGALITITSAALIIPIGILLAFGRRSRIPSIRICCTVYIELMRSVPLILIVYWVWIIVPLLTPELSVAGVLRGMAGFVIFYSAYAAEFVRSGLQSVPRGQVEAAQSLGMRSFDVNRSIVLPQALRVAVPALVGNVLDIFNYAPLVFIIGLTEFLRAGQIILANPQYSDRTYEIYVFLFVVYFAIGSLITFLARRLEAHLGRGAK